jgi:hypothetical protein
MGGIAGLHKRNAGSVLGNGHPDHGYEYGSSVGIGVRISLYPYGCQTIIFGSSII